MTKKYELKDEFLEQYWSEYAGLKPSVTQVKLPANKDREEKLIFVPVNQTWLQKLVGCNVAKEHNISKKDIGETVELKYEDDNEFDNEAVAVVYNNKHVGYFPQKYNDKWIASIIRQMKTSGYEIHCKFFEIKGGLPTLEQIKTSNQMIDHIFKQKPELLYKIFDISKKEVPLPLKPLQPSEGKIKVKKRLDELLKQKEITKTEYNKKIKECQKQWEDYFIKEEIYNKNKDNYNNVLKNFIMKNRAETLDKFYNLVQKREYEEIAKMMKTKPVYKQVYVKLLFIDKEGKKTSVKYTNTQASLSKIGFYED